MNLVNYFAKKIIKAFLILLLPFSVSGQSPSLEILFIGNSFMYNHDMAGMETNLINAAGIKAKITTHYALGQSIGYFIKDSSCWALIREKQWDYIVIQDNQQYYCDSLGKFDSLGKVFPTVNYNVSFQKKIKELIPCVKIIYFAGWERDGGIPARIPGDNTQKMICRISQNYSYLNNQEGVNNVIAPIGAAWVTALKQKLYLAEKPYNNFYFYEADGRHPGWMGSYLSACVLFVTMFHQSPVYLKNRTHFYGTGMDTFLKATAYKAVLDSFAYTNLHSLTPTVNSGSAIVYTSDRYRHYQWYADNKEIPGATSYAYETKNDSANYTLMVTNQKGCCYWSFPIKLTRPHHTKSAGKL